MAVSSFFPFRNNKCVSIFRHVLLLCNPCRYLETFAINNCKFLQLWRMPCMMLTHVLHASYRISDKKRILFLNKSISAFNTRNKRTGCSLRFFSFLRKRILLLVSKKLVTSSSSCYGDQPSTCLPCQSFVFLLTLLQLEHALSITCFLFFFLLLGKLFFWRGRTRLSWRWLLAFVIVPVQLF